MGHIFTCIDTRTGDNHHQNIISEPSDVSVTMGDEVTIPCDARNNQDECQWTLDGVILGQELSLPAYPRFTILDSGCDLKLYPVLPKDQGMYVCRAMPAKTYQVTVLAEPGQPHIVQARLGTVLEVRVGEEVTLQCESLGGIPAAEIEWMLGGIQVTGGVTAMTSMIEDSKTYKTVSTITMKVLQDMTVTCLATSSAFAVKKTARLQIRLLHKPHVQISINQEDVREGMMVELMCNAEVYPPITNYKWFINKQELQQEDVNYSCVATNAAGSVTQVVPHLSNNHLITYVLLIIFVTTIILLTVAFTVKNRLRRLERENVEKMEEQKKLHIADVCEDQDQP